MKNRNTDGSFNCMVCKYRMRSSLTLQWKWLRGSTNAADGHQMRVVDLNGDGVDDFTHIGFALNGSNGSLLYSLSQTYGVVHGDRFLIGKFDKDRAGLQGYAIQQDNPSGLREYYYDASSGQMIWQHFGDVGDLGRANAADLDPNYDGYEVWTFDGLYNAKSNTLISSTFPYPVLRMQWDDDILDECYNDGKIENWNYTTNGVERQVTTWNYYSATSSDRGAPMFIGDIIGDWREEAILTSSDYSRLIIFTTNIPTSISRPSFRNDRYYLNCLSIKGYVQSSYTSYYMGDNGNNSNTYTKIQNRETGLYVDGMGRTDNGANCGQWGSSSSYNQQWLIEQTGSYVKIKNRATGLYLDGMGRSTNGDNCGQWENSGSYNQQWLQEAVGSYVKFKNRATGLYLDGIGRSTNGDDLGQWEKSGSYNQQFSLSTLKRTTTKIDSKETDQINIVEVFPNPATSYINITSDLTKPSNGELKIYNLSGKLVLTRELPYMEACKITHTIDISGLTKGYYFVMIKTSNQVLSSKFLKQ